MSLPPAFTINLADEFPRLPKAPIIEAMIYWDANSSYSVDFSTFTDELARRLPNYPIRYPQQNIQISASFKTDGTSAVGHKAQPGLRLEDQNHHVAQFTPTSVALSRLAPYSQWHEFKLEALNFWDISFELTKPDELEQMGVRYINRIPLQEGETPSTYLRFTESNQEKLGLKKDSFFYQDIYPVPNQPYSIKMVRTIQLQPSIKSENKSLIIDIDVSTTKLIQLERETLVRRLDEMRWIKNKVFLNCISETALERFKG